MASYDRARVFSLGYQLRSIDEFVGLLDDSGVSVVVDVREVPWRRKCGFSKSALREALQASGIGYEHARFAGNPKELRRTARSHEDRLVDYAAYLDERSDVVAELDVPVGGHLDQGRSGESIGPTTVQSGRSRGSKATAAWQRTTSGSLPRAKPWSNSP